MQMLAKEPSQRPASAWVVAERLAGRAPGGGRPAAGGPPGLVGREDAVAQLSSILDAARPGGVALVVGESGSGRERLMQHAHQLATERKMGVFPAVFEGGSGLDARRGSAAARAGGSPWSRKRRGRWRRWPRRPRAGTRGCRRAGVPAGGAGRAARPAGGGPSTTPPGRAGRPAGCRRPPRATGRARFAGPDPRVARRGPRKQQPSPVAWPAPISSPRAHGAGADGWSCRPPWAAARRHRPGPSRPGRLRWHAGPRRRGPPRDDPRGPAVHESGVDSRLTRRTGPGRVAIPARVRADLQLRFDSLDASRRPTRRAWRRCRSPGGRERRHEFSGRARPGGRVPGGRSADRLARGSDGRPLA